MSHILLSRHAEAFFWMARYIERAATLARILEVQASHHQSQADDCSWAGVIRLYADEGRFLEAAGRARSRKKSQAPVSPDAVEVARFYIIDRENPGSIISCIAFARENARLLRHLLPVPVWRQLNTFYERLKNLTVHDLSEAKLSRSCGKIIEGCDAQFGVTQATAYRDESWLFFMLGLWIERADQTSRLLDVKFSQAQIFQHKQSNPNDAPLPPASSSSQPSHGEFWIVLLQSIGAYHTFRRVYPGRLTPDQIAEFLLFDDHFPRSIHYCTQEIEQLVRNLDSPFGLLVPPEAVENLAQLKTGLETAHKDRTLWQHMHGFNDWVQVQLMELAAGLSNAFMCFETPAPKDKPRRPERDKSAADTLVSQTQVQG